MNQDQTFRAALIIGGVIVLPVMAYYRIRSQATGEKLDRWQEGAFISVHAETSRGGSDWRAPSH